MARAKDWTDLIAVTGLETGWVTPVTLGERRFAVYDAPDRVYVTAALCTHNGANLCDGFYDQHTIECPLHQGLFDIRTGKAIGAPVRRDLLTFETRVENGMVQVRI